MHHSSHREHGDLKPRSIDKIEAWYVSCMRKPTTYGFRVGGAPAFCYVLYGVGGRGFHVFVYMFENVCVCLCGAHTPDYISNVAPAERISCVGYKYAESYHHHHYDIHLHHSQRNRRPPQHPHPHPFLSDRLFEAASSKNLTSKKFTHKR